MVSQKNEYFQGKRISEGRAKDDGKDEAKVIKNTTELKL